MNKYLKTLGLGLLVAGLVVSMVACKPAATEVRVDEVVVVELHDHTGEYTDAALQAWTGEQVNAVLEVVQSNYAQGRYDGRYSADEMAMMDEELATGSIKVFIIVLNDLLQDAAMQDSDADMDAVLAEGFAPELVGTIKAGLPTYIESVQVMEMEHTHS